jgi:hypothetical protein
MTRLSKTLKNIDKINDPEKYKSFCSFFFLIEKIYDILQDASY